MGQLALAFIRRDVPLDELAARDDVPDFITLLNTPQANTARDSDDASNIRFLNTLLKSRDVTPEQQLVALASRSLDDFYDDLD